MSHLHHKISQLVDGELSPAARTRAFQHMASCEECTREYEATLALKQRLLGLTTATPPPDLCAALEDVTRLPSDDSADAHARVGFFKGARRFLVGAGSLSAALISLAYVIGAPPDEAAAKAVNPPIEEFAADFAQDTGMSALADPAVGALLSGAEAVAMVVNRSRGGSSTPRLTTSIDPLTTKARGDSEAAIHLLERAVTAPERVAYAGTREIDGDLTSSGLSVTIRVVHTPAQGTSYRLLGVPGGAATFVDGDNQSDFAQPPVELLIDAYDVAIDGSTTVVGRRATVVSASRDGVVQARFYVDNATGLLLRRVIYDDGNVARATGFTSLHLRPDGFMSHLPPTLDAPQADTVAMGSAVTLSDDGWTCPHALSNAFAMTGLHRVDVGTDAMRADYSDGISTAAVFEQRGTLDVAQLEGFETRVDGDSTVYVSYGLPTVAVWASGDTVYTMVTDAPSDTADELLVALPHNAVETDGVSHRVADGFQRLGGALNPVR